MRILEKYLVTRILVDNVDSRAFLVVLLDFWRLEAQEPVRTSGVSNKGEY